MIETGSRARFESSCGSICLAFALFGCDAVVNGGAGAGGSNVGGGGGAGGGGAGGAACGAVQLATPTIQLELDGTPVVQPPSGEPNPYDVEVQGRVVPSEAGTLAIEPCVSASPCDAPSARLVVTAPDLPEELAPPDALVRLRLRIELVSNGLSTWSQEHVLVENLPTYDGVANPIANTGTIWFAVSRAGTTAGEPEYSPFGTGYQPCAGCWPPDYVGTVAISFPEGPSFTPPNGEKVSFSLEGDLAGAYTFEGLNGKFSCESMGGYAYWLAGVAPDLAGNGP